MRPNNIVDMVHNTVKKYPNEKALMWKDTESYTSITYKKLWSRIENFAAGLEVLGIEKNEKIGILGHSGIMWTITDIATASNGIISVPIYPTIPAEQVKHMLTNADATSIIVEDDAQYEKVMETGVELKLIIVMKASVDFALRDGVKTFTEVERIGKENPYENWEARYSQLTRDDLLTIIHTSGTTGKPKGAMLTHGNIIANIEGADWVIKLLPTDTTLSYLPVSHVFERLAGHFLPLSVGATIAYAESIETISENLKEVKPTILTSVPRLFEKVYAGIQHKINSSSAVKKRIFNWALKIGEERYEYYLNARMDQLLTQDYMPEKFYKKWKRADKLVFQSIRDELGGRMHGMVSGGGTLNPEIAKFFWSLNMPILEGYGLTETSPIITTNPHEKARIGTVGRVLPNIEVKIAEDGEVLVQGPSITKGYYNDPEKTAEAFIDGWFKTGDIGEFDEYGYLKILDRKKRISVLTTGMNVAPAPIESALNESRYIGQSLVVGDNRKYVLALINPEFETLIAWAKHKGVKFADNKSLCAHPEIQKKFEIEVEKMTKRFSPYSRPKKIIIISDEWSIDTGELTPKLSLKTEVIEKRYEDLINTAYEKNGD